MRRIRVLWGLFAILVVLPACSSTPKANFSLKRTRLTLTSEPADAQVMQLQPLNQPSRSLGTTPLEGRAVAFMTDVNFQNMPLNETQELLDHAGNVVVRVEKEGYQPRTLTLKAEPGGTIEREVTLQPVQGE